MSVLSAEQEQFLTDLRELCNTMLAIREMAQQAERGFQSGNLVNGRTALRRIYEESTDVLVRVGKG